MNGTYSLYEHLNLIEIHHYLKHKFVAQRLRTSRWRG